MPLFSPTSSPLPFAEPENLHVDGVILYGGRIALHQHRLRCLPSFHAPPVLDSRGSAAVVVYANACSFARSVLAISFFIVVLIYLMSWCFLYLAYSGSPVVPTKLA